MQTIWLSPTEYVTGDPSLVISYPYVGHPNTIVTSKKTGDLKWVSMGLGLPPNVSIEEIIICYQVSNPQSFISQIRLVEMDTPDQALVIHDDGTDLKCISPVRYISKVGGKVPTPGTAITLALRLNFQNTKHKIMLGAVGVKFQPTAELCANVSDYGAKGDGTDATKEIQEAIDFVASAGGGTVCVPPGLYIISKAIDLKDNIHLKGSGANVTTLKLKDNLGLNPTEYKQFEGSVIRITKRKGVTVSDICIDGNKDSNQYLGQHTDDFPSASYQCGIAILPKLEQFGPVFTDDPQCWSEHCLVEDCWCENCITDGIFVMGAHYIRIRNSSCHDNGIVLSNKTYPYAPFGIILADYTEHCIVEGCSAFRNPHGGIECWSWASKYHQIRYCRADSIIVNCRAIDPVYHSIIGCVVDNSDVLDFALAAGPCILVTQEASCVTVRDCHCIAKYNVGIQGPYRGDEPPQDKENNIKGLAIINNRVENVGDGNLAPYAGINIADCHDFIVNGNTLSGGGWMAIRIVRCQQGTVTGNSIRAADYWHGGPTTPLGTGIRLEGSKEITVTANSIRGFEQGVVEQNFEYGFASNIVVVPSDYNIIGGNILKNNVQPIGGTPGPHSVYVRSGPPGAPSTNLI